MWENLHTCIETSILQDGKHLQPPRLRNDKKNANIIGCIYIGICTTSNFNHRQMLKNHWYVKKEILWNLISDVIPVLHCWLHCIMYVCILWRNQFSQINYLKNHVSCKLSQLMSDRKRVGRACTLLLLFCFKKNTQTNTITWVHSYKSNLSEKYETILHKRSNCKRKWLLSVRIF